MPDPILNDYAAFVPHNGGQGVRFAVTATASTPVGIPGTGDAATPGSIVRIRVVVTGTKNACVRLNNTADRNSMVMIPGVIEVFTLPHSPDGVTISAITEDVSGSTTISAVAGRGT